MREDERKQRVPCNTYILLIILNDAHSAVFRCVQWMNYMTHSRKQQQKTLVKNEIYFFRKFMYALNIEAILLVHIHVLMLFTQASSTYFTWFLFWESWKSNPTNKKEYWNWPNKNKIHWARIKFSFFSQVAAGHRHDPKSKSSWCSYNIFIVSDFYWWSFVKFMFLHLICDVLLELYNTFFLFTILFFFASELYCMVAIFHSNIYWCIFVWFVVRALPFASILFIFILWMRMRWNECIGGAWKINK